jgi:hypothetical protein
MAGALQVRIRPSAPPLRPKLAGNTRRRHGSSRSAPNADDVGPSLATELADRFGPRRVEAARRLLAEVLEELGADLAVRSRRLRPPR